MGNIALGTWAWGAGAFGGDTVFGSKTDVENLKPVFDAAMRAGLRLWDTATVYGMGESERIVGVLAKSVKREEVEISTKFTPQIAEIYGNSVEREPGVICLYPMQTAEDSCQIRILEIYASEEAYQHHLQTDHFQKYKQGTLHMVKSLKLPTMKPLDPEAMKLIFKKIPQNP